MQTARGASLTDAHRVPVRSGSRRRVAVLAAVAVAVLAVDQVSKIAVVARLEGHQPVDVLDGVLTLRVIRNAGAAFGFAAGLTVVFSLVAVGVALAIVRTARRLQSLPWAVTLGLLLGGAVGNLCDRLFRAPGPLQGHVVDFLELPHWPVFNLADAAIVAGGALAVLLAVRGVHVDDGPPAAPAPEAGAPPRQADEPAARPSDDGG